MHHMVMPIDYHVWYAMMECYKIHMPKLTIVLLCWKTTLSTIRNVLLH